MQGNIDVSVVIPTRSRPELLTRAIRSVVAQTLGSLEIIVVVDGPDQATADAVREMFDPRIRLLALHESVGGAEARNIGARAACGRYIALLDDDDEWLPTKLEEQLVLADASPSRCFAVVTQYLYRADGRQDEIWPGHLPEVGEPLSEFLFSSRGGFQTSTYLCPRDLFLGVPFQCGLKKHQDWDWFLRLATQPGFNLLIVPKPLSIYWVPLRSRAGVSATLNWKFSYTWLQSVRALVTPTAYSNFLIKICVRSAMIQKENPSTILHLLRDLIVSGTPTVRLLVEFAACVLVPEQLRLRLRYAVIALRNIFRRLPIFGTSQAIREAA